MKIRIILFILFIGICLSSVSYGTSMKTSGKIGLAFNTLPFISGKVNTISKFDEVISLIFSEAGFVTSAFRFIENTTPNKIRNIAKDFNLFRLQELQLLLHHILLYSVELTRNKIDLLPLYGFHNSYRLLPSVKPLLIQEFLIQYVL